LLQSHVISTIDDCPFGAQTQMSSDDSQPSIDTPFSFQAIGQIRSCYKEKFGIPRQPGLVAEAKAELRLLPPYDRTEAVLGLEQTSHIWLQFVFHQNNASSWKPTVRPPRLGGNKRIGVFATRSPVRPNPIGLSVVKLEGIDTTDGVSLNLSGIDLLDGTPVLDIKPYIPYADAIEDAHHPFAHTQPEHLPVNFLQSVVDFIQSQNQPRLKTLIEQVLQQDPRPSYQHADISRIYGMHLLKYNIQWQYRVDSGRDIIDVVNITHRTS